MRAQTPIAALALLAALAGAGCSATNPYYDPKKPHHRPDGFANRFPETWPDERPSFWRWQWERVIGTLPAQDLSRVPWRKADAAWLRANSTDVSVTWFGHSSALWQVNGLNILTDPQFSERASPVGFAGPKRLVPLPLQLSELPRIDAVFISHNHYDHLDLATVKALAAQPGGPPLFIVPLGVDLWMREQGVTRVQKMDWWDHVALPAPGGPVTVNFVPVQHWSSRTPFDRNATLWGGFVLQAQALGAPLAMFYAGDTGYSRDFQEIGARFGPFDFAQIPVGCYLPRWFMQSQHVNEDEAVQIHLDLKSRLSMGVHWGSFRLCDDGVDAPIDGLPKARERHDVPADRFVLFAMGETRVLRRAAAPTAQQP